MALLMTSGFSGYSLAATKADLVIHNANIYTVDQQRNVAQAVAVKGNKIIYSPSRQEYTVIGNGFLQEKNDDRKIYGDKIYVNQLTGEAKVSGSEDKPVRFIINIEQGQEGK